MHIGDPRFPYGEYSCSNDVSRMLDVVDNTVTSQATFTQFLAWLHVTKLE